jgi:maltooligosyltrehalose synthase
VTWSDTRVELPDRIAGRQFRDAFTGATIDVEEADGRRTLPAATLFERFPIALLVPCSI